MSESIADHLEQLATGDDAAWGHLYEAMADDVLHTAWRVCGNQDLAQTLFSRFF